MRKLTGKWYLKKGWFGFTVMVQVTSTITDPYDLSESPRRKYYEKARNKDLINLKIPIA